MSEPTEQPVVDDQVGEASTGLSEHVDESSASAAEIPVSPTPEPIEVVEPDR